MTRLIRISLISAAACLFSLLSAVPVLAVPTLPSSFYGTVKVNAANVPDGTRVEAIINGQVYAEGLTQTYQGDSVYSVDIRGDDTDTPAQDGGREGDTVQFKVGGVLANQTGVWHGGTNVALNLTVSSSATLPPPKPSRTPRPTQTAIEIEVQPSATPAAETQLAPLPSATLQSALAATLPPVPPKLAATLPGSVPTNVQQTEPPPNPGTASQVNSTGRAGLIAPAILLILIVVAGGVWLLRAKK